MKETEDYIKTQEAILALVGARDVLSARALSNELTVEARFNAQIKHLENRKNEFIRAIETERQNSTKAIETKIGKLAETLVATDRKLKILENVEAIEAKSKEVELNKTLFEPRGSSQLIWLDDFIKEKYLHIVLCIGENDRPKNRYSLVAFGRCAFSPIMDMPSGFSSCHTNISDYKAHPWFDEIVHNAPTIEELWEYTKKNRDTMLAGFMESYKRTKQEYENVTKEYTLKDFEALRTIREISDAEAPIVFKMNKTIIVRVYKNFYYSSAIGKTDAPAFEHIKVEGTVYVRLCRTELMEIKQTGNVTFGDWWSTSIESGTPNEKTLFNKRNYERHIKKTKAWLKKTARSRYSKINWNPPQIEWVRPELLPSFF